MSIDAFGDFYGTGVPGFKTILTFQTGTGASINNNGASVANRLPAVYALDVTDPTAPRVVWEYTVPTPATPRAFELGQGLTVAMGNIATANGVLAPVTFVETNNGNICTTGCSGNAGGAGVVVVAINTATGAELWSKPFGYLYAAAGTLDTPPAPTTAVPGGAVGVDTQLNGTISALVFGDIVGDLWKLNPATGSGDYGPSTPLYHAVAAEQPIGGTPAIYAVGGIQFAAFATGGYVDCSDTGSASSLWSGSNQYVVSVDLSSSVGDLTEASTSTTNGIANVPIHQQLAAGDKAFAQLAVVGNELVLVTDSTDVNNSTYGLAATGSEQALQLAPAASSWSITRRPRSAAAPRRSPPTTPASTRRRAAASRRCRAPAALGNGTAVEGKVGPKGQRLLFLRTL